MEEIQGVASGGHGSSGAWDRGGIDQPEVARILPAIVGGMPEGVMITRRDGTIVFANQAFLEMTGYDEADVLGEKPGILRSGWQGPAYYRELWDTVLDGKVFSGEVVNRRKDGSLFIASMSITPVGSGPDGPQYFAYVGQDVTQQRRANDRLRLLVAATSAIADKRDLASAYRTVMELVCQLTGWSFGETWEVDEGGSIRAVATWYPEDDLLEEFDWFTRSLNLGQGQGLPGRVWQSRRPEWIEDVTEVGGNFIRGKAASKAGLKAGFGVPIMADGEVLAVMLFFARKRRQDEADLTAIVGAVGASLGTLVRRRRAEHSLYSERDRLAVTLRSIADGVITTDRQGRIESMNSVAQALTGWSEDEGRGRDLLDVFRIVNEFTRELSDDPVHRVLRSGAPVELANHTVLIDRHGKEYIIGDSAAPIRSDTDEIEGVVLVFRDETSKKRMERDLQRANKLDSLGVLAGGIAHDFNNALTGIIAHIGLAKLDLAPGSDTHEMLTEAEQACRRATSLTRQLLTFARGGMPIRRPAALEKLVRETASFAVTGSASRCEFEIEAGLPLAEIDEGQIAQVIHNLVLNASQATPEGGLITVSVESVLVGPEGVTGAMLAPRSYARISVRDRGPGVPPEYADRLFDPYFTTKERGSGLGLSVAYAVAKNHDGALTMESRPGAGATFHLYLPFAGADEPGVAATTGAMEVAACRILFMDDEETIRRGMSEVLSRLGHTVSVASDGDEAVGLYQQALAAGHRFDLVILDLTVPGGVGGHEAAARMKQMDPAVRAIASSGYSNNPVMARSHEHGFIGVLPKPYTPSELLAAITDAMRA